MQQVAYYCCNRCDSTWYTGWDKNKRIEDMTDACHNCSMSEGHEHIVAEPHLVKPASETMQ